jgi:hypothetical protein
MESWLLSIFSLVVEPLSVGGSNNNSNERQKFLRRLSLPGRKINLLEPSAEPLPHKKYLFPSLKDKIFAHNFAASTSHTLKDLKKKIVICQLLNSRKGAYRAARGSNPQPLVINITENQRATIAPTTRFLSSLFVVDMVK